VLTFCSIVPLFIIANKNFIPSDDESQFEVNVRAPEGSSLETTQVIMESIGSRIRELPEVSASLLTIGDDPQRTRNLGVIYVKLLPVTGRKTSQFDVMARIRQEILPRYSALDLRATVAPVSPFRAGNNSEIMFWVGGPDLDELAKYSSKLMDVLRSQPGVVDADTNLVVGKPELGIQIDRAKTADLGVQVQDVAATMNVLVGGLEVTDYYEGGEQYEVHVRADERFRRDATGIAQAEVPSRTAGRVKLKDVVKVEEGTGPSLINRIARRRQVLLSANMAPGFSSQTVIDALNQTAAELNLPPAYSYGLTGRSREQGRAARNFMMAFLLSFIFMYLILAAQFESWLHPATILLALPMTIPFALLSIVALNQSINIFSSLGILVLFGIVKKNGILQIDHMNGLRGQGVARDEAILHANRDRLRPILMTTLAFVAGMIPLVVSSGTGAGTNRAIGIVVIGGQSLALLLTLIGIPIAYSIFDDWSGSRVLARVKGWFRIRPSSEPAEAGAAGRNYRKTEA
jgi:HAE1 family hydrophobic/amphiphilic exporter-1